MDTKFCDFKSWPARISEDALCAPLRSSRQKVGILDAKETVWRVRAHQLHEKRQARRIRYWRASPGLTDDNILNFLEHR
jgi:hypothetical protein